MIILLHGRTAVGKSTVACHLCNTLSGATAFHTAVIREKMGLAPGQSGAPAYEFKLDDPVFTGEVSRAVYGEMLRQGCRALPQSRFVIFDGTYNFRWQREQVYQMAADTGSDLLVLHCICEDEEEIKTRLANRAHALQDPFAETNSWETYQSTKNLAEPPDLDFPPSQNRRWILTFDTDTLRMKYDPAILLNQDCRLVVEALKGFPSPRGGFGLSARPPPRGTIAVDFDGVITNPHRFKAEELARLGYPVKPSETEREYCISQMHVPVEIYERAAYAANCE